MHFDERKIGLTGRTFKQSRRRVNFWIDFGFGSIVCHLQGNIVQSWFKAVIAMPTAQVNLRTLPVCILHIEFAQEERDSDPQDGGLPVCFLDQEHTGCEKLKQPQTEEDSVDQCRPHAPSRFILSDKDIQDLIPTKHRLRVPTHQPCHLQTNQDMRK